MVEAALRPPLFKAIYDYYKGKKFPELPFFMNTVVREFGVDQKQAETCCSIFTANMKYVGLVRSTTHGDWLTQDFALAEVSAVPKVDKPALSVGDDDDPTVEDDELALPRPQEVNRPDPEPSRRTRPNKLFVGHGRNHKAKDQLVKLLRDLGIPHMVATDEPNAGRPISDKVRETMEQCGAAVLIFTADVEYFDKEQNPVWRPSENVSHELGAASIMYDNRVILFKKESIDLASNYSGIGYITFEKDKLDAKMPDLLRELVAYKILRLSVSDDDA